MKSENSDYLSVIGLVVFVVLGALFYKYYVDNYQCDFETMEECMKAQNCSGGLGETLEGTKCLCDHCYKCRNKGERGNGIFGITVCPAFTNTQIGTPYDLSSMNEEEKQKLLSFIQDARDTYDVTY